MPFWTGSTPVSVDNLARLGPQADGFVGTDGAYGDLYDAMGDPAGPQWRRVVVLPGATLGTDLSISSANYGRIVTLGGGPMLIGGTGKLTFTDCIGWALDGLVLTSTACVGLPAISFLGSAGNRNTIRNCWVYNSTGGGIYTRNHTTRIESCLVITAAGNGIEVDAATRAPIWITQCNVWGCGGWGIVDGINNSHIIDCDVTGNTAGQISTTSAYAHNNKVT